MILYVFYITAFIGIFLTVIISMDGILPLICEKFPKFRKWVNSMAGISSVDVAVPSDMSLRFRDKVLSYDFKSDDACLTHHKNNLKQNGDFTYFTFDSDFEDDIDIVISMLPKGSMVFYG